MIRYNEYSEYTNEQLWDKMRTYALEARHHESGDDDWYINEVRMILEVLDERLNEAWGIQL